MSEPDDFDPGPFVCPGCYAIGEPCAPHCIDHELELDRADDFDRWYDEREDDCDDEPEEEVI